jgi:hypothetical protein
MALTFDMKVTGLCSGIVAADRNRIDTVLLNANATMVDLSYHLQSLFIESRYLVAPPAGLPVAPPLGSFKGRVDVDLYSVHEDQFTAWDLNGAVVRVCEAGEPVTVAQLDIPRAAATGEYCDGDWSDLHWVLDVGALAAAVKPGLKIDPEWRNIDYKTLAIFEMLKGTVRGTDPYYTATAGQTLRLEGEQRAQSYTDSWLYEYVSPDNNLLLQIDRRGVTSYIACRVPAGGATVSALLLNEGTPRSNSRQFEHMLAYYDLLGPAGGEPLPGMRKKLVYAEPSYAVSTVLGDGAFCMSTLFSQSN